MEETSTFSLISKVALWFINDNDRKFYGFKAGCDCIGEKILTPRISDLAPFRSYWLFWLYEQADKLAWSTATHLLFLVRIFVTNILHFLLL